MLDWQWVPRNTLYSETLGLQENTQGVLLSEIKSLNGLVQIQVRLHHQIGWIHPHKKKSLLRGAFWISEWGVKGRRSTEAARGREPSLRPHRSSEPRGLSASSWKVPAG